MYLLPKAKREAAYFLSQLSKRTRYRLAIVLDIILIAIILINGKQPAQRLISPFVSSLHSFYSYTQNIPVHEVFTFVPDLARNKFPRIDMEGLTHLSFFDVPLTEDGTINFFSKGYASFTSVEALELFDRARFQKTKIFLTLSAIDTDIIANLLDNLDAQQRLADQAAEEIRNSNIDGIAIDFEFLEGKGKNYQKKFTQFISRLTGNIHLNLPKAQVAVAIPSTHTDNESLFNIEDLGEESDRVFLIASNFIVPEVRNAKFISPVFGYSENEYFTDISGLLNNLQTRIPAEKLVLERAWYGSGDNYPLYVPGSKPEPEENRQPSSVQLDQDTLEKLVAGVPQKGKDAARKNIPFIATALAAEGILDSNVLAYALATVEHETDETFEPIGEIQGTVSARRLGYEGGANFYGRGFIQITHLRNYQKFGERIGLGNKLVKNPELAKDPEIAAKILAAFFRDNNVANLASRGNFVAARRPINPDYNGYPVAVLAAKYDISQ